MTLRIASSDFALVDYDADGDVLYLAAGDPERAPGDDLGRRDRARSRWK